VEEPGAETEGHGATGVELESVRTLPPTLFGVPRCKNTKSNITPRTGQTLEELRNLSQFRKLRLRGFKKKRETLEKTFWSTLTLW
jgi:hypothetical protein